MDAKLIKTFYGYELLTQGFVKGSTNHELIDSLNIEEGTIRYKLSHKNCQAIERGYDLDELAKEFVDYEDSLYHSTIKNTYMHGFQKALSILGDKKFSEEDIRNAILFGEDNTDTESFDNLPNEEVNKFIQDLQQTEWCVEIVMEDSIGIGDKYTPDTKPKLDADNCIILKRKI